MRTTIARRSFWRRSMSRARPDSAASSDGEKFLSFPHYFVQGQANTFERRIRKMIVPCPKCRVSTQPISGGYRCLNCGHKIMKCKNCSCFHDDFPDRLCTMCKKSAEESRRQAEEEQKKRFEATEPCGRCGGSLWKLESMSPNAKSATWACSYCGKKQIIRGDQKAEKVEGSRPPIPKAVQREVWRRDEGQCVECGSKENLEYDHIIPHSRGGATTTRNLQLLCERCNRKKSDTIG